MNSNAKNTIIGSAIVLAILVAVLGPFLIIWGLNILFPVLNIPYTLETWAAIVVVRLIFESKVSFKS
jgi:hypothetical protein